MLLERIETAAHLYLAACLLGGLFLMIRALGRVRSVTARRQLGWIVWGSSLGALPFVLVYLLPFLFGRALPGAEYTAVLLGCIPLAFASAIVRYRLMDIEVIIKKALVVSTVIALLIAIYAGTLQLVSWLPGADESRSTFWAMLATLIVALVAPWLRNAIQAGLDRLYYRDRYDYRRALMSFARDLNSDLDLDRLTSRLVERVSETLGIEHMAIFMPDPRAEARRFKAVALYGFADGPPPGSFRRARARPCARRGGPTVLRRCGPPRWVGDRRLPSGVSVPSSSQACSNSVMRRMALTKPAQVVRCAASTLRPAAVSL